MDISTLHTPEEAYATTAQKIIRSTLSVLGTQGIGGLTTKNISEKSHLSTGIIHHYFDTKENLIYVSYVFLIRHLQRKTLKVLKQEGDPRMCLWRMVKIHFGDVQLSQEATSVWPHFWSIALHDSKASRLLHVYSRRLRSNFASRFMQLGFSRSVAHNKAQLLLFAVHGAWIEHRICRSIDSKDTLYANLYDLIEQLTAGESL